MARGKGNSWDRDGFGEDAPSAPSLLGWQLAGVCLLVVCVLLRFWQTLSHAGLYVEDGLLFNHYYGHQRPLADIFTSHIGQRYLTVTADFLAWFFAWFDVQWQPWLYQWTGFAIAVCSASLPSFSGLISNRWLLLLAPLFFGMLGLNHLYYYNTLMYVMYTGVLLLLTLLICPPPTTRLAFGFQAVLMLILPWSGPYSAFALPATMILFFCTDNRSKRVLHLLAFCSTLIYCLMVTGSNLRLERVQKLWIVEQFFNTVFEKIILFNLFPSPALEYGLIPLLFLGLVGVLLRRETDYLQIALVMMMYLFGTIALFFLSIKFAQYQHPSACHLVTASFFWIAFLIITGERILRHFQAGKVWSFCYCLALLSLLAVPMFTSAKEWMPTTKPVMQGFLDTVSYYEQQGLVEKKMSVCLFSPRPRMPPMVEVGYRGADVRALTPGSPEITHGRRFVCRGKQ